MLFGIHKIAIPLCALCVLVATVVLLQANYANKIPGSKIPDPRKLIPELVLEIRTQDPRKFGAGTTKNRAHGAKGAGCRRTGLVPVAPFLRLFSCLGPDFDTRGRQQNKQFDSYCGQL